MAKTLVDHSKMGWTTTGDNLPTLEQINTGSLQRIAVTLEALNRSWCYVQEDNARLKLRRMELENSNRALKGQITKLNKRLAVARGAL